MNSIPLGDYWNFSWVKSLGDTHVTKDQFIITTYKNTGEVKEVFNEMFKQIPETPVGSTVVSVITNTIKPLDENETII